ncbi:MAG TPA: trans-aconitate 2-methyltransferase [Tepidisphaeraceae bacterium]|jgi:trans-aconitate 2-methyltransferase|nr:trans-aconitate 2-methyltransferase [Tepidisphaeraceae bacterium]
MPTWNAHQYLRFEIERTRPCRDLAGGIAIASAARVIDLGCGPGNSTAVLAERWPSAEITGLDSSPEMIAAARESAPRLSWAVGDIAAWASARGNLYDVVFSNAALQWVENHAAIFPSLLKHVAPGGALAIQVPGNFDAPAHRMMREIAESRPWRDRFPPNGVREWHVHDLASYYDLLAPAAGAIDLWETEYLHILPDAAAIVEWYKGTGLRPFLNALSNDEQRAKFLADYLERIAQAFLPRSDGRVIFPFRRFFMIAYARS